MAAKKKKQPAEDPIPPQFVADNPEQEAAIAAIQDFIKDGDADQFFTLEGKAGTGKTTIMQEALAPFIRKHFIVIGALSHKAKLILAAKLKARFGGKGIQEETIASMLGMTMDVETGKFRVEQGFTFTEPPITYAGIVVIDECSMVNEEALREVMTKKPMNCKVIFLGDIGQLPPIREAHLGNADTPSPTFNTFHTARLTKRVRQGEESPILPYADLFWENSQSPAPIRNPADPDNRSSIVKHSGSLVFSKANPAIDAVLPLYKEAVETGNHDIVRIIAYMNKTRKILNDRIRKYIFGNDAWNEFNAGELIIFQDNYGVGPDKISNSTESQVKHVKQSVTKDGWNIFELGMSIYGRPREIEVLATQDVPRFKQMLDQLAGKAKALPYGPMRSMAWKEFYIQKERFAPVEYAYAITSHKSQGSTYDVSVVAEADIMAVTATSNKSKSQSIYTSITRAKHLAIILDGFTDHPGQLEKAINMLQTQRNNNSTY